MFDSSTFRTHSAVLPCLAGTPMHRALSIPEVLRLVLSSDVDHGTLRNAALTCSLWMDPALDELWQDLDSVFPLLWVLIPLRIERIERWAPGRKLRVWVSTLSSPFGVCLNERDLTSHCLF